MNDMPAKTKIAPAADMKALYEKMLGALSADDAETAPSTPVDQALLAAKRIESRLSRYRSQFATLPTFDIQYLDVLPIAAAQLKVGQTAWQKGHLKALQQSTAKSRKEAEALRKRLLKYARYLFRKDPEMLSQVNRIAEGTGEADLVNDLNDLAEMVSENSKLFLAIKDVPKDAEKKARGLAAILEEGTDPTSARPAKRTRNLAAAVLDMIVTELRDASEIVLSDEPQLFRTLFQSHTAARKRRLRSEKVKGDSKKKPLKKTGTDDEAPTDSKPDVEFVSEKQDTYMEPNGTAPAAPKAPATEQNTPSKKKSSPSKRAKK
jgi:hypothetical protein